MAATIETRPGAPDGMRVFDKSTGQLLLFRGAWQRPVAPAVPASGDVLDVEARATSADLVTALIDAGIFRSSLRS